MADNTNPASFIPWSWAITPNDTSTCPSARHVILTFLVTTIITTVLGIATGYNGPWRWVIGHVLGKKNTVGDLDKKASKSWRYMWIFQLGFHLGPDFLNAAITIHSYGWKRDHMPAVWDLALFYASRPRLAWIVIGPLGVFPGWASSAKQLMITESIMHILGSYYMGRTANFASKNGWYRKHDYDHWAQMMYGGALFTLITTIGSIFGLCFMLGVLNQRNKAVKYCCTVICAIPFMDLMGILAFVGRLLFLIGYVKLAGELYCPPKLLDQAVIWVVMNVSGILFGTVAF